MIEVISFDFDGTLTKTRFADLFWLEGVPKLYATENNLSLSEARRILLSEYDKVGKERIEWYDPDYWFNRFNINYSWHKLMENYSFAIELYPDVISTLEYLRDKYELIVISNARKEFIQIQMDKTGLNGFFNRVFSSVSDFSMVKKNSQVYEEVCSILQIRKNQMIHIGDDYRFDYEVPRSVGINSIYLDREGNSDGEFVVHSLKEIPDVISIF
ncbi:MAG TPA: HAD family hydrolase [Thermoplasmatales archaeon]|nr:HAD family hydrolase [Thermoplasmatales archaeon]